MPSSEIYHEKQGTNHGNPADGLSGSDGPVREPHRPCVRRKGGPAVDLRGRQMPRGHVPLGMVLHAGVRGIPGQRRRQFLRWLDEESHERHDQLQ